MVNVRPAHADQPGRHGIDAEARMITVQVWDKATVPAVDKAIREANLGLNPIIDGTIIRLPAVADRRLSRRPGEARPRMPRSMARSLRNAGRRRRPRIAAMTASISEDEIARIRIRSRPIG
jgi:ribosome recycling factor